MEPSNTWASVSVRRLEPIVKERHEKLKCWGDHTHCLLAPLRQPAADRTPDAPSSTHQGRGCRTCSSSHQQAFVPSPLFTQQLTPLIEHKLNIPTQLELCKFVGLAASWNGPRVDCELPRTGIPRPQTKQAFPQKYADKHGDFQRGWQAGWLRPRTTCKICGKQFRTTRHCLPHPLDTARRLPKLFVWEGSQSFPGGVRWVGQGGRCELYWETGKPKGLCPMNGASPKKARESESCLGSNQKSASINQINLCLRVSSDANAEFIR
eukprot:818881-Pelagomonas_calceolata.AAC.6